MSIVHDGSQRPRDPAHPSEWTGVIGSATQKGSGVNFAANSADSWSRALFATKLTPDPLSIARFRATAPHGYNRTSPFVFRLPRDPRMYFRLAKRMLLETDKRLVWKLLVNMGWRGVRSVQ